MAYARSRQFRPRRNAQAHGGATFVAARGSHRFNGRENDFNRMVASRRFGHADVVHVQIDVGASALRVDLASR
jgi:hypothetical protein